MKRKLRIPVIVVIIISTILGHIICRDKSEKFIVDCYLYDPCGGCFVETGPCKPCTVEMEYTRRYRNLFKENNLDGRVSINIYNVLYPYYESKLSVELSEKGVNNPGKYPLIFIQDRFFIDDGNNWNEIIDYIKKHLTTSYIIRKSFSDIFKDGSIKNVSYKFENKIVFFTMKYCNECKKVDELFDSMICEKGTSISKKVHKYDISIDKNQQMMKECMENYGKGDNDVTVPMVIINDDCLIGYDEIKEYFINTRIESKIKTRIPIIDEKTY